MIDFLITSTVCLSIFLGFYHLLLEKEKMHSFNRFYLLSSVIISLLIPFLNFEIIKEIPAQISKTILVEEIVPIQGIFIQEETSVLPIILWSLYTIITFVLFIRFGKNILQLLSKIRKNPTVKHLNAKLILVEENTLPHTFWNAIFINFDDYNSRNIEDELYTHELVHVTQKHTVDILFIETLKTVFWFNPLFYFYKKAIQLNHEFLADEGVVNQYDDVSYYQSILLQKSNSNQVFITSNLNYSLTKKRLIMMTKNTSKAIAFLKKVAILPVLIGMIYFFCIEIVAQEKTVNPIKKEKANGNIVAHATVKTNKNKNVDEKEYYKGVRIKFYENKDGKVIFDKLYEDLTTAEKKKIEISLMLGIQKPIEKKSPSQQELNEFKNSKKFAIWIDGNNVSNTKLDNYKPKDFAHYSGSVILKNARTKKHPQPFQYWFYTHSYYEKNNMGKQINKYPGDEIVIWKDGNTHTDRPTEKSSIKSKNSSLIKNEKLEVVAIGKEAKMEMPTFSGGISEFYKFVGKNFKIPNEFKGKGKIFASFIIEKDGSLTNIEIKKDLGFGTKEETIRVLNLSPKWIPAKVDNEIVRYEYSLPILIDTK
jgi:beta-lactamase regulating signal transducer with metallopeptidase domain